MCSHMAVIRSSHPAMIGQVMDQKFTTVICSRCKFTEVYSTDSSGLMNVFDFFTN